ncbi:hypothetical protein [Egicoccus sp. AB-alg2]|uniref:hypothetical protein n=1 Tax=Egicoccus sp. AB-alg2 TaxID=3242693 RepID=UPI00359DAA54
MTASPVQVSPLVRFAPRFVGPFPGWTNGGVIAGTLADRLGAGWHHAVSVRIERPVPLSSGLQAEASAGRVVLRGGEGILATAQLVDDPPLSPVPIPVEAARATAPVLEPASHPAPGCFVCGPSHPDGLNLQPGTVAGHEAVATVWEPAVDLASPDGTLPPPVVWAALDCPSWYGATRGRAALLGAMHGRQFRPLPAGQPVVVTGWGDGRQGRKSFAGAALHTPGGELIAAAASIWIHPRGA